MSLGEVRVLHAGLGVGESPRWRDGRLFVSDMYRGEVIALDLDGKRETVVAVPGRPSGLGWLPNGDLLVVSIEKAEVMRFDGTSLSAVATLAGTAPMLNDMVVSAGGYAYVSGMPDLTGLLRAGPGESFSAPHENIYLVEPDGGHRIAADAIDFPNGAVITPDGRQLIVAETLGRRLTAFDIEADGSLANRRVWAELEFLADGICLDTEGCIWVASPEPAEAWGFWRVAEGGEIKQRIPSDRHAVAVMLGGPERDHLFMLEASVLDVGRPDDMRIAGNSRVMVGRVDVPGAGLP
jgi:sugar lactone lactonase YvrE